MKRALDFGFSCTDREVMNEGWLDGSTSVVMAVTSRYIMVANAGDSRAVLMDGNKAVALSCDHKPSRPDEQRRIEKAGGFVMHLGVPRVNGVLAVSRALGDAELKALVPSQAEYRTVPRSNTHKFAALATDGVWDVLSNQEVVDMIAESWDEEGHGARRVCHEAYNRGSFDNICIMVLDLSANASGLPAMYERGADDAISSEEEDVDDAPFDDSNDESTSLTTLSDNPMSENEDQLAPGVSRTPKKKNAAPSQNRWTPEWEGDDAEGEAEESAEDSDAQEKVA